MRLEHLLSGKFSIPSYSGGEQKNKEGTMIWLSPILLAIGYDKHKRKMKPSSSEEV